MHPLRQRFGRALRLGVVGGGPGSWIGGMHRTAAELDGWWQVVAGVFSSEVARSRAASTWAAVQCGRAWTSMTGSAPARATMATPTSNASARSSVRGNSPARCA